MKGSGKLGTVGKVLMGTVAGATALRLVGAKNPKAAIPIIAGGALVSGLGGALVAIDKKISKKGDGLKLAGQGHKTLIHHHSHLAWKKILKKHLNIENLEKLEA